MKTIYYNNGTITRKNFKMFLALLIVGSMLTFMLAFGTKAQTVAMLTRFEKATLVENHTASNFEMGVNALLANDDRAAIRFFSAAIEENSMNASAFNKRGCAQARLKHWKNAIKDFDSAINLDSSNAEYYYHRGLAQNKAGKYAASIKDCNKALALNGMMAEAYLVRGIGLAIQNDKDCSMDDFKSAITYMPDYAEAYYNIGLNYYESHDDVNARKYLNKAKKLGFENPELSAYLEN